MSTTTQRPVFAEAQAAKMPTLYCVGYVGTVGDGHVSNSEPANYIVQPITLEALDAGRGIRLNFLYRPEWLVAGYDPDGLLKVNKSAHFVYSRNIAARQMEVNKKFSVLRGLAGSREAFEELASNLLTLPVVEDTAGPSIDDVQQTLTQFFEQNTEADGSPKRIGYVLKQKSTKTNKINPETGKNVYVLEPNYEVESFFDFNEEEIKKKVTSATRNPETVKLTFEVGVPF